MQKLLSTAVNFGLQSWQIFRNIDNKSLVYAMHVQPAGMPVSISAIKEKCMQNQFNKSMLIQMFINFNSC